MEDIGKFVLYALAVGIYYFIRGRNKAGDNAAPPQTAAKPFMSPAADSKAAKPNAEARTTASIEDLLRRVKGEPPPPATQPRERRKTAEPSRPVPTARVNERSLEGRSLEEVPDQRSLETASYDEQLPQYRNEAADVDYEIPEKARYQGLDGSGREGFKEFERQREKPNRYAELLKSPASARDAFVLSEIFRRKEF